MNQKLLLSKIVNKVENACALAAGIEKHVLPPKISEVP